MQQQVRADWWSRLVQAGLHPMFRLVSIAFSAVSGWFIYWFFNSSNGDPVQRYVAFGVSVGFVILGYFLPRGIAHRLLHRKSILVYLLIEVPYVLVEVISSYGHAVSGFSGIAWIHALPDSQFRLFSFLYPVVASCIPFFNVALAVIDVDLMREKGALLVGPAVAQPRQGQGTMGGSNYVPSIQASYPPGTPPMQVPGQQGGFGWSKLGAVNGAGGKRP